MVELERTYLAKYLPEDLASAPYKDMLDIYIPKGMHHPILRIRKNGSKREITKKSPIQEGDASKQLEETIHLTVEEYQSLANLAGKRLHKTRYNYHSGEYEYEIDVFLDDLAGLVLVDVEFDSEQEMESFEMPEFCLAEVTQETFLAGGMVCGKSYDDLRKDLERYNYQKVVL